MRRSRIQIGPSGLLYLVVAVMIIGAAVYTQANLLFWSFGLMVGGFIVSIFMSIGALRKVTVTRLAPGHGVAGEPMVLRYQLTNGRRIWPVFNLVIREMWGKGGRQTKRVGPVADKQLTGQPTGWILHLAPGQTALAEAICWPTRRGMVAFEWIEISTTFPFGVIKRQVRVRQEDRVLVYPHLYRMNRRMMFQLSEFDTAGRQRVDRGGGQEEFFGLRPYRTGDRLKMIDWKHTARMGELVSREYTLPSPPRIMIVLDLTPANDASSAEEKPAPRKRWIRWRSQQSVQEWSPHPTDAVERAVSLAASLVCDAYFYGYKVGLVVTRGSGHAFSTHHSLPHRTKMLEALSTVQQDVSQSDTLAIGKTATVVIQLGDADEMRTNDGRVVLSAARLERYIRENESAADELLSTQTASESRRDELRRKQDESPRPDQGEDGNGHSDSDHDGNEPQVASVERKEVAS